MDQLFLGAVPVEGPICDDAAGVTRGEASPAHAARGEAPVGRSRDATVILVGVLVARVAAHARHSMIVGATLHVEEVPARVHALPGSVILRMAVGASRVLEDRGGPGEQGSGLRLWAGGWGRGVRER